MKKKIVGILATLACLTCFASCAQLEGVVNTVKDAVSGVIDTITGNSGSEEEQKGSALESAKSFLDSVYKPNNGASTVASYSLMGKVNVKTENGTEVFSVSWTVDNEAVEIVKNDDGSYTVNILNKEPKEDIVYNLTATIKDAEGNTLQSTYDRKIPLVKYTQAEIVDMAYALEAGQSLEETLTLTGVISSVPTAYDAGYKNVTVIIKVAGKEDKPITCYRLKGDGADVLDVGDTVTVSGTLTNYSGTIEFTSGCEIISYVKSEVEVPTYSTPAEIVNAAYALETDETLPGGKYTLVGKITKVDTPYDSSFNNITVTIVVGDMTDKPIVCFRLKGDGADAIDVGNTITVSGTLMNYAGTVEFNSGCTLDAHDAKTEETPDDTFVGVTGTSTVEANTAYKFFMNQVSNKKTLYVTGESANTNFLATTETASEGADVYAEAVEGGYKFYINKENAKHYLYVYTYTNSKGGTSAGVGFSAENSSVYTYIAESNCWATTVDSTEYYLGSYGTFDTISASKTDYINAENTGVSQFPAQFLKVEGTTPDEGGDETPDEKPTKNFLDVASPIAGKSYYLYATNANGKIFSTTTVTEGYLTATTNSADSLALTFEAAANANEFYLYYMDGETKTYIVGNGKKTAGYSTSTTQPEDTWVVDAISKMIYSKATNRFISVQTGNSNDRFCTYASSNYGASNYSVAWLYTENASDVGETPVAMTDPTEILTAAYALSDGQYLLGTYSLTGVIKSVDAAYDPENAWKGVTVTIEVADNADKPMVCYGLKGDGIESLAVGDTITASGRIKNYQDTIEYDGCQLVSYVKGETETPDEGGESENPEVPSTNSALQEGIAYTVSANNANGPLYLTGTISSGRFDCSTNVADAISVYVENVSGGQLLYMLNGTEKVYFVFADKAAGGSTTTDATAATVFEWNATLNTLVVADDDNNRAFGSGVTSTYTNFSAYDANQSGYNWGQFTAVNS